MNVQTDTKPASFNIVVFSSTTLNPDHLEDFKSIVETVCTELDVPIDAFFSTAYDVYRKPCLGMWPEFEKNWNGGEKIGELALGASDFQAD